MKIKFCGAAQYVTGSSHLVELSNGYKILLDCGLFQGKGVNIWKWNNEWLFEPKNIDCLILSHAHIDHCGRLPKLVKDGFRGDIHSTHATRSLAGVMLLDSAKIQESDVEYYNRKLGKKRNRQKETPRVPLYTSDDVFTTMQLFSTYPYDKWVKINQYVDIYFTDAGHILGSACITLRINDNGKEIILGFTGDIGRP